METQAKSNGRKDTLALWSGVVFSLLFTALIWWSAQRLAGVPHLPDQGASWYFWKLPQATSMGRLTSWSFYLLHQFVIWGLISYAQSYGRKYTTGLHKFNIAALGANAFFIVLHLVQTQVWYDGLAQDTPIWTSFGSVAVMLIWILLMENPRRGVFFGKKLPIGKSIIAWARKYHGYFFAWATIYTFWFHPMENTPGHLVGFLYMFLLLLQGSLFFTRAHTNRVWTTFLEVVVLVHGTLVAMFQGNNLWPMFAFGFGAIFIITQMWGLGLNRWAKTAVLIAYVSAAAVVYSRLGWTRLNEIIRIPLIDYLSIFILAGLIGGGLWIARKVGRLTEHSKSIETEQG